MKKQTVFWLLTLTLFLCLFQSPAQAKSPAALPEGVTEIDLRTVLGNDAKEIAEVWIINENVCAILRESYIDCKGYEFEIIVLDILNHTILSRTPVPPAQSQYVYARPGLVEGVLYLQFESWGDCPQEELFLWPVSKCTFIKASVFPDGTVDIGNVTEDWAMTMPGNKTSIREGDDGSLYAIDLATRAEELLIQGFSEKESSILIPNAIPKYIPFWDELPSDGVGIPYEPDDIYSSIRDFFLVKPLDEHRFVYGVSSWEWNAGFGVYDLQTRTDHRITGRLDFFCVAENTLFGSILKADANTYETWPLPESVQDQFAEVSEYSTSTDVNCSISPDGNLLAVTGLKPRYREYNGWMEARGEEPEYSEANTVIITDVNTGDMITTYDIYNPLATEYTVSFYDNTHFMLFCRPEEFGYAYIYLFDAGEQLQ